MSYLSLFSIESLQDLTAYHPVVFLTLVVAVVVVCVYGSSIRLEKTKKSKASDS